MSETLVKKIAKENEIEYLPDVRWSRIDPEYNSANRFYAIKGEYILLHPANDGLPTCPFEWYFLFDGKERMIMDNQSAFKNITNLSEILSQITRLYTKYIDDSVIMAPDSFTIRLVDEVCPDYKGKASLVLTDSTIRNSKVKKEEILEAKKYFINAFLDHFIGWNFGVTVRKDKKLEKKLIELNNLVIEKGLRIKSEPGFDVWCSDDVQQYCFKNV